MRKHRWLGLIACTVLLLAVMVSIDHIPRLKKPEIGENRVLAQKPAFVRNLAELRAYPKKLDAYVADNFPARPFFIAGINYLRYRIGYSGTPKIVVGSEGWLFYDDGSHLAQARHANPLTAREREAWISTFVARTEQLHSNGIQYIVIAAPVKERVYNDKAPRWARNQRGDADADVLRVDARRAGYTNLIGPREALMERRRTESGLYSPYDTHWTSLGAYVAYTKLFSTLNELGHPVESLPLQKYFRDDENPHNLAGLLGISSFIRQNLPHFWQPSLEANLKVTYLTDKRDWTSARVVETGLTDKPLIQLTLDSFSTELLHFLYPHFSKLIISHLQDGFYREDLTSLYKPDFVVLEVIESGLRYSMSPALKPDSALQERIIRTLRNHGGPNDPANRLSPQ
jgi:hypothetical protein